MIDFPASPTDGQIFSATNGVVYKYSTTYSSWLAQNAAPPLGGTGDFCFQGGTVGTTLATLIPPTAISGNSGLWYNTSNGRYTPPAGRYVLSGFANLGSASAGNISGVLRKNGTNLTPVQFSSYAAGGNAQLSLQVVVDANGADWFDFQASTGAGSTVIEVVFSAFPLTGIQGPTGGAPGPVVGDLHAYYNGAPFALGPTPITINFATVATGNSGGYYNPANSRYTPPAGRFLITALVTYYNSAGATGGTITLRKNGSAFETINSAAFSANQWANATIAIIVDANGSDWFDIQASASVGSSSFGGFCSFNATPTQGMVGPQGPPGPPGSGPPNSDFSATQNIAFALPTGAGQPLTFNTVVTGNSGGYYSTSTGRYTPPAGRYFIQAMLYGANSTTPTTINLQIRKNGTVAYTAGSVAALANFNGEVVCEGLVDANGTDYFDLFASSNNGTTSTNGNFTAFPTQGMVGPQGPMGPIGQTQTVFFETGAVATGTNYYNGGDVLPASTNGDQYMQCSITPLSATSKLFIDVTWIGATSQPPGQLLVTLHQDALANAIALAIIQPPGAGYVQAIRFTHCMISGTTSPTTFKVRAGANAAGYTTTFNGTAGGRYGGGVMASSIVIREVP